MANNDDAEQVLKELKEKGETKGDEECPFC